MENFQKFLHAYAQTFLLHPKLLQDGITLLSRIINLETSTRQQINFHEDETWRYLPHAVRDSCRNIVYLKVWDQHAVFNEFDLVITRNAQLYTGQTQNWRARERNLQFYLRDLPEPTYHICIGHNVTNPYHRDALEVGTMAWVFYIFGLMQINRSPYALNWYSNIDEDVDVDDITPDHYRAQLGWTAWRYSLLVGTAPPQTVIDNPAYRDFLLRDPDGLMDLNVFRPRGNGLIRFLDLIGTDGWSRFLDHFPGMVCDRMNIWGPSLTNERIEEGDVSLVRRLVRNRASLAVMLGHWPTRLTADTASDRYMVHICGKLTAKNLPNGNCVLLLWTLDPAINWRIVWNKQTYQAILHMVPLIVNVIEKLLHQMGARFEVDQEPGITEAQAESIINWYNRSLLGRKLMQLTNKFREEWNRCVNNQDQVEPTEAEPLFSTDELDFLVDDVVVAEVDQTTALIATVATQIIDNGVSKTLFRDKGFDTRVRRRCKALDAGFDYRSDVVKANALASECFVLGEEFRATVLRQRKRDGIFVAAHGETTAAQIIRCWRELWDQRIATSSHPASVVCTCVRCGRIINKVLQDGGNRLVLPNGCACRAGSRRIIQHLSRGWHFVIGDFHEIFPNGNIFRLLFNELLRENCVLNGKQLMVLLVRTVRTHADNPQARTMLERFGSCFDALLTYSRNADVKQSQAQMGMMKGLRNAFHDLHSVKIITRDATSFEKDAYGGGNSTLQKMPLYAFGMASQQSDRVIYDMEEYDYLNYQSTLVGMSRKRRRSE